MEHFPFFYSSLQLDSFLLRKMYIPCSRICSFEIKRRIHFREGGGYCHYHCNYIFCIIFVINECKAREAKEGLCSIVLLCLQKLFLSLFFLSRMLNRSPSLGIDSSIRLYGRFLDDC